MNTLTVPVGFDDHVRGPVDARVVLVEYLDYECSFCARAYREVEATIARVGQLFRFAARHFPRVEAHPHARLAAQAVEAAAVQEAFWPMHGMVFENRNALDVPDLSAYAAVLGLDVTQFVRDLRNAVGGEKIDNDVRSGIDSGVHVTPTFFLDGALFMQRWDRDTMTRAIEDAAFTATHASSR
jgi:protein-disulfide isomerase